MRKETADRVSAIVAYLFGGGHWLTHKEAPAPGARRMTLVPSIDSKRRKAGMDRAMLDGSVSEHASHLAANGGLVDVRLERRKYEIVFLHRAVAYGMSFVCSSRGDKDAAVASVGARFCAVKAGPRSGHPLGSKREGPPWTARNDCCSSGEELVPIEHELHPRARESVPARAGIGLLPLSAVVAAVLLHVIT
eukprot:scaffold64421_cov31-Tisochrysis_lutea.AAC.3